MFEFENSEFKKNMDVQLQTFNKINTSVNWIVSSVRQEFTNNSNSGENAIRFRDLELEKIKKSRDGLTQIVSVLNAYKQMVDDRTEKMTTNIDNMIKSIELKAATANINEGPQPTLQELAMKSIKDNRVKIPKDHPANDIIQLKASENLGDLSGGKRKTRSNSK